MANDNREFWQFSDKLRLHTTTLSNLSISDSIWSTTNAAPLLSSPRRNLDPSSNDDVWKMGAAAPPALTTQKLAFAYNNANSFVKNSNDFIKNNNNNINIAPAAGDSGKGGNFGNYFNNNNMNSYYNNGNGQMVKNYFNKAVGKPAMNSGNNNYNKKNTNNNSDGKKKNGGNNNNSNNNNNLGEKRFKTLPPSEALPRNEAVGGYIFVCNNDTMQENLKRQLFGLPPRYRDSVRAITPGLPLFLYNYSTHQLHGIFEAASFGGTNIDPTAWEDKKSHGESRFPAQVQVMTRKICEPLEEDSFRPILHHYDGPKFRLELSVPEALALLDIFAETNA